MENKGKRLIVVSLMIFLVILICSTFDSSKIKINAKGMEYKKAEIDVSYDNPLFACKYENNEEYHYNGQEIIITCRSNVIPGFKFTSKKIIDSLYYTHYGSICKITERWINASVPDSIVAIYQKTSSKYSPIHQNDYIIVVETSDGYKSYIERNLYSHDNGLHEYVIIEDGVASYDVKVGEYKNIDNLDSFINEIKNDKYNVLVESYQSPLYIYQCY